MGTALVECVPNFSEGRDRSVLAEIVAAIAAVPGARVLDASTDPDHNRSVATFVAPPESAGAAAFAGMPVDDYPNVVSHAEELVTGTGADRFHFAVDTFLDGLVARSRRK